MHEDESDENLKKKIVYQLIGYKRIGGVLSFVDILEDLPYRVRGFQAMLMSCCAYSCTQYGLHTQYMLLTTADVLLCLQLHTVRSAHTVHAANHS